MFGTPPRQGNLPKGKVQHTEHQKFIEPTMARVMKTDDYYTKGKIEVLFLNRTRPVPVWVLHSGASPKPEVGDYALIGYIDGQKNNPYLMGLVAHHAWTSNFIRVEKGMIRLQFPFQAADVNQGNEGNVKSHLRDDATYLATRGYIQIDANGIKIHAPAGIPVNVNADTVNILKNDGSGTLQPVARVGDTITATGTDPQGGTVTVTGTITSGSSTLKSV